MATVIAAAASVTVGVFAEIDPPSASGPLVLEAELEPATPFIERRGGEQLLNFDLSVTNRSSSTLRLAEIEMSIFDSSGILVMRKAVNSNGLSPGIAVVASPLLPPGQVTDIFNPFYSIPSDVPIGRLSYALRYRREDTALERDQNRHRLPIDYDAEVRGQVFPRVYQTRTDLVLPLAGRVFVWDGHDFYSHHRRIPLHAGNAQVLGLQVNSNRYAADLVIVDEAGNLYHGDPYEKKNWYTYGAAIYAPGRGIVAEVTNGIPDNTFHDKQIESPSLPPSADAELGNHVVIDHGNGEFSVVPHMLAGSVTVKPGESVRQGQPIGRVGFSGDALFPHVHYSLRSGRDVYRSEGVPAYFKRFRRLLGRKTVIIGSGTLDTGDFVTSDVQYLVVPRGRRSPYESPWLPTEAVMPHSDSQSR